ncbi:putative repeat protein (TIGR01451 family) [Nocardioides sp. HB32]
MKPLTRALISAYPHDHARRAGVVVLTMALAALALVLVPAAPARAAGGGSSSSPSFVCTTDVVYSVDGNTHVLSKVNPTAGTSTPNGTIPADGSDDINALALPSGGGRYIYAFNRADNSIIRFDATTNDADTWSAPSNSSASSVIAGAINPANGIYYYASGGSTWKLFAFNTNTNTSIGQVGTFGGLSSNGDMAFDATGNLYVVSNASTTAAGTLARVNGPLPTTAGTTALTANLLTTLPDNSGQYASMAFNGDGYLVVGTGSGKVLKINPSSGVLVQTKTVSLSLSDMASCTAPSVASARVDLPQGRHDSADQFKVAITGGGVTTGNTGTTTGTDTGLQDASGEVAGPVVVLPSTTYTITQTASGGTDLNDYTTTWKCVKAGDGSTLSEGTGNSGTFTMPSTSGTTAVCTFTNLPLLPAIEIDKTAGAISDLDGNGPDAGDTVTYSFKVTDTGNTALSNIAVTDAKVGAVTCPQTTLAVGASMTCTPKSYTLLAADVTAGKVDNTASVTGKGPNGVIVTDDDTVSTIVPANPRVALDKVAGAIVDQDSNGADAGDKITYTFKVTNTGNVPLTSVGVTDAKVGTVTCAPTTLAPGDSVTCTAAPYVLTQADVNAGVVNNSATAKGTPPTGSAVTATDTATVPVPSLPAIEVDKSASTLKDLDSNGPDVGDVITYSFVVTNRGNVGLTLVAVSDPKLGGTIPCPTSSLDPGQSMTCPNKDYTLTQADVNNGRVDNTATATGKPPTGSNVTDEDSTTTILTGTTALVDLDKVAGAIVDLDGNGPDAGDRITYTFKVTNIGTVTLNPVSVTDPKVGTVTCSPNQLAPGASVTCTAPAYVLTQADVDLGRVQNTATAHGTPPTGPEVTDQDTTNSPVPAAPALELDKSAGPIVDGDSNGPDAGDTVTYSFTVKNTGNVTLIPVTVSDPKLGAITCPGTALAPGATVACTNKAYALTQADVDGGTVANTATAHGTPPTGSEVTDTDSTTTPVPAGPSLFLDKVAGSINDTDGNGPDAGDTIVYSFTVKNTGNVTLNPVTVSDPKLGGAISCPSGPLAPGATVACTDRTYALTQADVNAGTVANTATAHGTPPTGSEVTDTHSTTTPVAPSASINLVKTASAVHDLNGNGIDDGDTVTYTFKVTNAGNVTLTNITVADPKVGPVSCPSSPLAPGASVDCDPRTYTLTQADVDNGSVDNTATVTGSTPTGGTVTDDDSRTVDLPATGSIQLSKTASAVDDLDGNGPDAGDTVSYSFQVTNTGNVKLDPVTVSDPKVGPVTCPSGGLDPDESFECTDVVYTVTAADVTSGGVDNTATATGRTPDGGTVQDTDSTHTPVQPTVTNVKVVKTVDDATPRVGDVITYTLTVTNTGAANAHDVVVTDALPSGVTFVSADAACDRSGSTVRCELGTVPAGGTRSVDVQVRIDPLPELGADHQHLFDVQKAEVQVDVEPGDEATGTVVCPTGYVVTDGSGRIDHVDQGTGTLADLHMTENHAVGNDSWRAHFVNEATGRAQAKVFSVCVKTESEVVNGHSHHIVVGDLMSHTEPLPHGRTDVTLNCGPGQTPIQPGYVLDGIAPVLTTYPSGTNGWTWGVVNDGGATTGTFTMRCLDDLVSVADGHTHHLGLDEVRQHITVQPGQEAEFTLSCADDAKGIVAGYDIDAGLVVLGNDPRPIIRVFKFYNPTSQPLSGDLYLLCLKNRTEKGADQGGHVVNTATVTTSTPETTSVDNSDSVSIQVDDSPVVTPLAPLAVSGATVSAAVRCGSGGGTCKGRATLVTASTIKVGGRTIKAGTVLAKGAYKIRSGKKGMLRLHTTAAGKRALGSKALKKATLRIGGDTRTVRLRH